MEIYTKNNAPLWESGLNMETPLFVAVFLPEYYMDRFAQSTTIMNLILGSIQKKHKNRRLMICVFQFSRQWILSLYYISWSCEKFWTEKNDFSPIDDRSFSPHLLRHHPLAQLFLQSLDIYFNCQHTPF